MNQVFHDMMGREVRLSSAPKRIISVVPSQTELLHFLGLEDEVVGITKFCVHPQEWFRAKERVGGTKQLNIDKIRSLQPDLIIANKEENEKAQIELLANEFPVWISDIKTINEALEMIGLVGRLVDKPGQAEALIANIRDGFQQLRQDATQKKVAYFIWYRPWMAAGIDTFINDVIATLGWTNVCANLSRYPELTPEQIKHLDPQLVLLSSEPFPFKQQHVVEIQQLLPDAEIRLVDGEVFSWYGSRMLEAIPYLNELQRSIS